MKMMCSSKKISFPKQHKKGSALIAVLCVLAVLMALSAALMVSTHSVVNNNSQYSDTIQCKVLNDSYTDVIKNNMIQDNEFAKKISSMISGGTWLSYDVDAGRDHDTADKNLELKDDDIVHSINMFYYGTNPYQLFINVTTTYRDEQYSQKLHFVSVTGNGGISWHLASVSGGENQS